MHYAQIDPTTRLCIAVSTLSAEVHAPHLIPIDSPDRALLGRRWDGAQWQAPPPTCGWVAAGAMSIWTTRVPGEKSCPKRIVN